MRTKKCDYCPKEIFFGTNQATGRPIPLEVEKLPVWIPRPSQRADRDEPRYERVVGYRSHYETCPGAAEARARAKEKKEAGMRKQ